MLGPTVAQLGSMEVRAQTIFHALQNQFGRFQTDDESFNVEEGEERAQFEHDVDITVGFLFKLLPILQMA